MLVIVTGGGSLIRGFGVALQTKLLEEGFENPRVRVLGENYKDHVARGALQSACAMLDATLSKHRHVLGDEFSVADAAVYHTLWFVRSDPVVSALARKRWTASATARSPPIMIDRAAFRAPTSP